MPEKWDLEAERFLGRETTYPKKQERLMVDCYEILERLDHDLRELEKSIRAQEKYIVGRSIQDPTLLTHLLEDVHYIKKMQSIRFQINDFCQKIGKRERV